MATRTTSCNCGQLSVTYDGPDPAFPPPILSGFEAYGHPWAMSASDLPIERHD